MNIDPLTPKSAAIHELGERLARVRKQQGLTQAQLAREAGLGIATLRRIEDGRDAQLGSWYKLLKALNMVSAIDALLPETFNSPMSEVKARDKRARKPVIAEHIAIWGDEQE
jgi:transcriptional regulator with XRE-family HTH domain